MKINPKFKKVAFLAVRKAGKIIEKNFRKINKVSFKKDLSLLTKVDIASEKTITQLIKNNFPSHNILAEERGGKIGNNYTWIIDPLDGTTNYSRNIPFFSISLALTYRRNPILGVIFNPISKELYFAEKGKGAFLNGQRIKETQQQILSRALILFNKYRTEDAFRKIHKIIGVVGKKSPGFRIFGSVTLTLCYLASGKSDACFAAGMNPWDLSARVLIIKEAGGKVTNLKGEDWQLGEKDIIAANKKLHNQLLKLIK